MANAGDETPATLILMLFKRVLLGDCDTQFCIINDNKLIQNVMMTEALNVKAQGSEVITEFFMCSSLITSNIVSWS